MKRNLKRWLALGSGLIGMVLLVLWLPGCQAPAKKEAAQPPAQSSSDLDKNKQAAQKPIATEKLDPSKDEDLDKAKAFVEKLLHDTVGNEARRIEVGGYPNLGGFGIETRFNVESLDKERIRSTVQEIYRAMVEQFPGPIYQLQVAVSYTAEYRNGQPIEKLLVTTYMRSDKLYKTNWDAEAYPWQCVAPPDEKQIEKMPCVQVGQPPT